VGVSQRQRKKENQKGKKKNRRKPETHSFPVFHHTNEVKKHPQKAEKNHSNRRFPMESGEPAVV